MKKICFITTISRTLSAFFLETAKYLHEHTDWDISFICSPDDDFAKSLPEYIHFFPVNMKRGIDLSALSVISDMKKIFKREHFDMIQYSTPNAALFAAIAGKAAGIPIRNYHLMGFRYLGANGIFKIFLKTIEKFTCKISSNIECVSKSNMEFGVVEKIFPQEKATIVWNGSTGGVNLARFDITNREKWRNEIRSQLGYSADEFIFGFVGRITRDKGTNELLEAFSKLSNCKLLLVGNPEGIDTLDAQLYQSAKSNPYVKFIDAVCDVEKYYAAIDVLVLPSYREGFGMVIAEAAAMGTPAIVSNIPGPTDVCIDGVTGAYVEAKNCDNLYDVMNDLMNDKQKVMQMSANAANYIRSTFDSAKLNEHILQRKQNLLNLK